MFATNTNALIRKKDATNLRHAQWDAEAVQMTRMKQEHAVQQIQSSLNEFQRKPDNQVINLKCELHDAKKKEQSWKQASLVYYSLSKKTVGGCSRRALDNTLFEAEVLRYFFGKEARDTPVIEQSRATKPDQL